MRKWTRELLNGYIQHPSVTTDEVDDYITPSSFGQNAGMVGCLTLAHMAYEEAGGLGGGAGPVTATTTSGCCTQYPVAKAGGSCSPFCKKVKAASGVFTVAAVVAAVALGALAIMKANKN